MNASVKDVMTRYVVAVQRGASFKDMAARLSRFRVSAFPVVDEDGTVIGVVSEGDMLARQALSLTREALADRRAAETGMLPDRTQAEEFLEPGGLTAGELMSHPAVTITPDESVEGAARLMYNFRVKRLPVVDDNGHLVGIISRADVLAVFDRSDEEIRREITDEVIAHEFALNPRQFTVTVRAGVVTLEGSLETATLGRDIARKVRHVQGVVAVRDRLSYPPE